MESRQTFLYQSIADLQGTIRAIDIKIGYLLLIVFTPLFALDKIQPLLSEMFRESWVQSSLVGAIIALWILAIFVQFMALVAITNPTNKVPGAGKLGSFFSGDLYRLGVVDAFANRNTKARRTVKEEVGSLPDTEEKIVEELTFEKMKLAYIRSIKSKRANTAIFLTVSWLSASLVSFAVHLVTTC